MRKDCLQSDLLCVEWDVELSHWDCVHCEVWAVTIL